MFLNLISISSEQLVPMLGLTTLAHTLHPETTLDKLLFLVENFPHANPVTTVVSFSALGILVFLRTVKGHFTKYWWIYRIPEVLVVVVVSTSKSSSSNILQVFTGLLVLSAEFRWDEDGVDILGSVPINFGRSFVQFPLHGANLGYLRRTTSTAV